MKTAKTQTAANSVVTSGPKYCEGEQTTSDPGGEYDSIRVAYFLSPVGQIYVVLFIGYVLQLVWLERSCTESVES